MAPVPTQRRTRNTTSTSRQQNGARTAGLPRIRQRMAVLRAAAARSAHLLMADGHGRGLFQRHFRSISDALGAACTIVDANRGASLASALKVCSLASRCVEGPKCGAVCSRRYQVAYTTTGATRHPGPCSTGYEHLYHARADGPKWLLRGR